MAAAGVTERDEAAEDPYRDFHVLDEPVIIASTVIHGFGRGGKKLGCPTANLDPGEIGADVLDGYECGVYCGWAKLDGKIYEMVMSIGW